MLFYPFKWVPDGGLRYLCFALMIVITGCCGGAGVHTRPGNAPAPASKRLLSETLSGQPATPERIILNLTAEPATSQAVTWRTRHPVGHPQAQIAQATGFSDFDKNIRTVDAQTQKVAIEDGSMVYHHAVVLESLAPDTLYAYRVGAEGTWSEWSQFKTASLAPAPFTFVYFGDPQEEVKCKCSRIFRAAFKKAPDADFWHFIGDLVDNGDRDDEWAELFYAFGWIPRTTPMILLPGNHEYPDKRFVKGPDYKLFHLWRPHFTLPENGPAGLEETVYFIDYQGVRLVMLNGNERLEEQARWLDRILTERPQPWTIAAIHQPVYSTGKWRNKTTYQRLLVPVFDKHAVDLVLQGHDHTYGRTFKLKNNKPAAANGAGTVYVTSVSGPKSYPVNPRYHDLMEKTGTGRQLFQVIHVDAHHLKYESIDATGALYDAFELEK